MFHNWYHNLKAQIFLVLHEILGPPDPGTTTTDESAGAAPSGQQVQPPADAAATQREAEQRLEKELQAHQTALRADIDKLRATVDDAENEKEHQKIAVGHRTEELKHILRKMEEHQSSTDRILQEWRARDRRAFPTTASSEKTLSLLRPSLAFASSLGTARLQVVCLRSALEQLRKRHQALSGGSGAEEEVWQHARQEATKVRLQLSRQQSVAFLPSQNVGGAPLATDRLFRWKKSNPSSSRTLVDDDATALKSALVSELMLSVGSKNPRIINLYSPDEEELEGVVIDFVGQLFADMVAQRAEKEIKREEEAQQKQAARHEAARIMGEAAPDVVEVKELSAQEQFDEVLEIIDSSAKHKSDVLLEVRFDDAMRQRCVGKSAAKIHTHFSVAKLVRFFLLQQWNHGANHTVESIHNLLASQTAFDAVKARVLAEVQKSHSWTGVDRRHFAYLPHDLREKKHEAASASGPYGASSVVLGTVLGEEPVEIVRRLRGGNGFHIDLLASDHVEALHKRNLQETALGAPQFLGKSAEEARTGSSSSRRCPDRGEARRSRHASGSSSRDHDQFRPLAQFLIALRRVEVVAADLSAALASLALQNSSQVALAAALVENAAQSTVFSTAETPKLGLEPLLQDLVQKDYELFQGVERSFPATVPRGATTIRQSTVWPALIFGADRSFAGGRSSDEMNEDAEEEDEDAVERGEDEDAEEEDAPRKSDQTPALTGEGLRVLHLRSTVQHILFDFLFPGTWNPKRLLLQNWLLRNARTTDFASTVTEANALCPAEIKLSPEDVVRTASPVQVLRYALRRTRNSETDEDALEQLSLPKIPLPWHQQDVLSACFLVLLERETEAVWQGFREERDGSRVVLRPEDLTDAHLPSAQNQLGDIQIVLKKRYEVPRTAVPHLVRKQFQGYLGWSLEQIRIVNARAVRKSVWTRVQEEGSGPSDKDLDGFFDFFRPPFVPDDRERSDPNYTVLTVVHFFKDHQELSPLYDENQLDLGGLEVPSGPIAADSGAEMMGVNLFADPSATLVWDGHEGSLLRMITVRNKIARRFQRFAPAFFESSEKLSHRVDDIDARKQKFELAGISSKKSSSKNEEVSLLGKVAPDTPPLPHASHVIAKKFHGFDPAELMRSGQGIQRTEERREVGGLKFHDFWSALWMFLESVVSMWYGG